MAKIQAKVESLKKLDLHRHIEGSVSPKTMFELCRKSRQERKSLDYFKKELILEKRAKSLDQFIKKLGTRFLKKYVLTPDDLAFVFSESIAEVADDNVSHLELRFSPSNFLTLDKSPTLLVKKISQAIKQAERDNKIKVKLILCLKRDDLKEINFKVVEVAKKLYPTGEIAGLDLAGNEHFFPNELFGDLARKIKKAGIPFLVHAGEVTNAQSVKSAVELLGAARVGHGTKAAFDDSVIELLVRKNILLEICPTSNLDTSAYDYYEEIPIRRLLDCKVPILICTDDPVTSGITLTSEVANLIKREIITLGEYKKMLQSAVKFCLE